MEPEPVRMWRPPGQDRLLLMAGRTTEYAVQPRDEYVFGVVDGAPMASRRGRERRTVAPGELVAWDPSRAHVGVAVDGTPWTARLMVVEAYDLAVLVGEPDTDRTGLPADISFPEPVVSDAALVDRFRTVHTALAAPTATLLARDEAVTHLLRALVRRAGSTAGRTRPRSRRRDDRALRTALDYLAERPDRNVGLDELAAVAGVGRARLIDAFREGTGLAPHAFQLAYRVRAARRLLEGGATISAAAAATGFVDQSHLHRHFQRSLGITPGEYRHHLGTTARP
jgi:AraC-like DNA-binding protein